MSDDMTFCQRESCGRKNCKRHPSKIIDRSVPHSFFVNRPPDCPYAMRDTTTYWFQCERCGGISTGKHWQIVKANYLCRDCVPELWEDVGKKC